VDEGKLTAEKSHHPLTILPSPIQPGMPGYPGQIHANIGPIKTNVTFDHRDCGVTLLKNDHVLINLLVDMVTRRRRAANIKPKIPFTFSYTKETRELVTHPATSKCWS